MLPIVIDFGTLEFFGLSLPVRVHGYGLAMVLGFITGIYLARWRARRCGENPDVLTQCGILALVGGVLGARLAFVIEKWDAQFAGRENVLGEIFNITSGGLIYYGGVIAATVLVLVYLFAKRLPIRRYLDMLAVSLMVGLAFGRVGCLLNGCCYGGPSRADWPVAMRFPMFAKPLLKLDGSSGPFSEQTDSPTPVYSDQLRARARALYLAGTPDSPRRSASEAAGHVCPDPRLVNQFDTSVVKIEQGGRAEWAPVLLLHPPRYLHGKLESNQLAAMFASPEDLRKMFDAAAGIDARVDDAEWSRALAAGDGLLRGSEHWDEAVCFDADGGGRLDFEEMRAYLLTRRQRLMALFGGTSTAPVTGPAVLEDRLRRADAYLKEDLLELATAREHGSLPVKPAQAIGIVNALVVAGILFVFFRLRSREGQVFALMMIVYPMTRFVLEMIRNDNPHNLLKGVLTHNQYSSMVFAAAGVVLWLALRKFSASAGATRGSLK